MVDEHERRRDARHPVRVGDRYGYIDDTGSMCIEPRWHAAGPFVDGLARVGTRAHPDAGTRWGFIAPDGELVIPTQYTRASDFSEGCAAVNLGGEYRYIDRDDSWSLEGGAEGFIGRTGRTVGELRWTSAAGYSEGTGVVRGVGTAWFVDRRGQRLRWGPFADAEPFADGLAAATRGHLDRRSEGWGWIDASGEFVIAPRYARVERFAEGLAPALDPVTYTYLYVDRRGDVAFRVPGTCRFAWPFAQGRAVAMQSDEGASPLDAPRRVAYGYLDHAGAWAIPPRFDDAASFSDGCAAVRIGRQHGFIDVHGATVVPIDLEWAGSFSNGVAIGIRGGRCHAFRADGSVLWRE